MKKIFMALMLCLVSIYGFGQERVNREKIHFTDSSGIITNAIGWSYNEILGEWIDYENVLCENKSYKTKYKLICGSSYMKSKYSNFNTIQIKKILFESEEYYVAIVNRWDGEYKYPSIREDWYEYKENEYWVLKKTEYYKLFELSNEPIKINGSHFSKSRYDNTPEDDYIISKLRSEQKSSYLSNATFVQVYKATDGSIRFLIYPLPWESIEKCYFEIDENEWNKLKL